MPIVEFPGGIVSRQQQAELHALDAAIVAAVESAKAAGVPQGLIVSVLRGHELQQALDLIDRA